MEIRTRGTAQEVRESCDVSRLIFRKLIKLLDNFADCIGLRSGRLVGRLRRESKKLQNRHA
jgi:hypothetical protein